MCDSIRNIDHIILFQKINDHHKSIQAASGTVTNVIVRIKELLTERQMSIEDFEDQLNVYQDKIDVLEQQSEEAKKEMEQPMAQLEELRQKEEPTESDLIQAEQQTAKLSKISSDIEGFATSAQTIVDQINGTYESLKDNKPVLELGSMRVVSGKVGSTIKVAGPVVYRNGIDTVASNWKKGTKQVLPYQDGSDFTQYSEEICNFISYVDISLKTDNAASEDFPLELTNMGEQVALVRKVENEQDALDLGISVNENTRYPFYYNAGYAVFEFKIKSGAANGTYPISFTAKWGTESQAYEDIDISTNVKVTGAKSSSGGGGGYGGGGGGGGGTTASPQAKLMV